MRAVLKSEALKIAQEHDIAYFETSAKENINLKEVMTHIMCQVYENLYAKAVEEENAMTAKESIVIG